MKNYQYGPTMPISQEIHAMKYRGDNESFEEAMKRLAGAMADGPVHRQALKNILLDMKFLPAGRVQSAMGSPRDVTAFNCFVSGNISDSMSSIMKRATEAAETMRKGGGIGYDFSKIRPKGDLIRSLDSRSSGPVSFMKIYDAVCQTIASAGHRRGAQMGVLRVDHPDIEEFIRCKRDNGSLTGFNISVGVTDAFMQAVKNKELFDLTFDGKVYKTINAENLWNEIMQSTWDWAEPGILFIDRINQMNNLWYCEEIAATNPCGEQPLPPQGACLLGSFNLVKYVKPGIGILFEELRKDVREVVRAMDNVIDRTTYPLSQQEAEAKSKRRMGLGVTGLANALEMVGRKYGSQSFLFAMEDILATIRDTAYETSAEIAREKGAFPLFDERYLEGAFIKTLPEDIQDKIKKYGIRNSHLLSIAPTGTISLCADNVSSGIEPPFTHFYDRTIQTFEGPKVERVFDYAYLEYDIKGRTANEITVHEHVDVLCVAQKYVDSSISKTCNVGDDVTFEEFKDVYMNAYDLGAKGCTTFRAAGKRYGILTEIKPDDNTEEKVEACFIDPITGKKECE